jgi:hypothetical protein
MRTPFFVLQALIFFVTLTQVHALDIGPMKWTPRSDWLDVKTSSSLTGGPDARGDGTTDDTKAIQAVLQYIQTNRYGHRLTIYFPAGTYKITNTLTITDVGGIQVIGCGSDTTLRWDGAKGGAMFWPNSTAFMRYTGLTWDGNNLAGCAYEHNSALGGYETQIRHENESFRNFTVPGNYTYTPANGHSTTETAPAAAIIGGFAGSQVMGETMIYNCKFQNCGTGVINAYQTFQNYMWHVEGCEFEHCGTGINFYCGGCWTISNCHFEGSTNTDISGGFGIHALYCTSVGSNQFYNEGLTSSLSQQVLEDCWVDGWKNPKGGVRFASYGANSVFDCTFTHPPAGAEGIIREDNNHQLLLLSHNDAPDLPTGAKMVCGTVPDVLTQVPPGTRNRCLKSAAQTFLKSTWPADGSRILDVTGAPYGADPGGHSDSTAGIQKAIDDARQAGHGAIVYFPPGNYRVTSTLKMTGSHYAIEGAGVFSKVCWWGADHGTMMTVDTPQDLAVRYIDFAPRDNGPNREHYDATTSAADATTVAGIRETSTGASSIVYDDFSYTEFYDGNPGAIADNSNGLGLVLSSLPTNARVYIPHSNTPLTVENCGAARIFAKFLQNGMIRVSGTAPKSGFLGSLVTEGGQYKDLGGANITVKDNQDLVFGNYYTEQGRNDLRISGDGAAGEGRVTIQGVVSEAGQNNGQGNASTTMVRVDNYAGRLFYGSTNLINNAGSSTVQVIHTGTNKCDLVFSCDTFEHGAPDLKLGPGAHLIQTLCQGNTHDEHHQLPEVPNPLTPDDLQSISHALDHLRELEAADLEFEFGMTAGPQ